MVDSIELKQIAKTLFWWKSPEEAMSDSRRFLAQVMNFGTWKEVQVVKQVYGLDAFKDALRHASPGVMDARSWSYWHNFFGWPEAEMPRRSLT